MPTDAGRYEYALSWRETKRPTSGSKYLKYQAYNVRIPGIRGSCMPKHPGASGFSMAARIFITPSETIAEA